MSRIELKNKKYIFNKAILSFVVAIIFNLAYLNNVFVNSSLRLEDLFFQREDAISDKIVVIGVTSDDLHEYGMWPWDRITWANVIKSINSNENTQPAAIGITIPFYGRSQPISDARLTNYILSDNVFLACSGDMTLEVDLNHLNTRKANLVVTDISYPFVCDEHDVNLAHTNILLDQDGVLRHDLLSITNEKDEKIYSMSYEVFNKYRDYHVNIKEFKPNVDDNGLWYVDFTANSGKYFNYSVKDILDGNYDQADLTGKIVLIGSYDSTLLNYYTAPIDRSSIYSVDFTANCIDAMLKNSVLKKADSEYSSVLFLLGSFIFTFFSLIISFKLLNVLTLSFFLVGSIIIQVFYKFNILISPFYLFACLIVSYSISLIYNYWFEWYTKKQITNIFKQHVDPKVVNKLIDSELENINLIGEYCDIAVLFVDIRGFTSMSESLEPSIVVNILNQFLQLIDHCIICNEGTLDKIIGDCVMAFWGAPIKSEDPVFHACCAAIEMIKSSKDLTEKIYDEFGVDVSFGIGLHYGTAIVGNVGSNTRYDYTAVGAVVNTASRLENIAPKQSIYVSKEVVNKLQGRATVEKLADRVLLKGVREPVEIYLLKDISLEITDKEKIR